MAEGDDDAEVQQHDPDQEPAQDAGALPQEPDAEPHADDAPDGDAEHHEGTVPEDDPNPLEPRGKRFKQVYARAKTAETTVQQLREEKARLEGELAATRATPPVPEPKVEPRLTWDQLEAGIEEGKISRAKAMEYDRESLKQELERKFEQKLNQDRSDRDRRTTVSSELSQYKQTVPAILSVGTPERQKVEREFVYLVNLGHDPKDLRTELMAMRAALGDVQTLKEKQLAREIPNQRGTMQEIPANGKPKSDAKDPLKTITGEQRKYYQRMIDKGQYAGWKAVREELEFTPKR